MPLNLPPAQNFEALAQHPNHIEVGNRIAKSLAIAYYAAMDEQHYGKLTADYIDSLTSADLQDAARKAGERVPSGEKTERTIRAFLHTIREIREAHGIVVTDETTIDPELLEIARILQAAGFSRTSS